MTSRNEECQIGARRFRLLRRNRHDSHRRRDQLRRGQRGLSPRQNRAVGDFHFDRAIQVMSGVRLWQIPTLLGERGKGRHREKQQHDCYALQQALPALRRSGGVSRQPIRALQRHPRRRFARNVHDIKILGPSAPRKQEVRCSRVSCEAAPIRSDRGHRFRGRRRGSMPEYPSASGGALPDRGEM